MAAFNFPNSPSDGDTHTENGLTYVWDGTNGAWKRSPASLSKGVKGDKGDAGTDGDKGSKGDNKGEQGDKGEPGDVTAKGAKGEPGDKGDEGDKGDKGDVEAQGNKGDEGQKGEPGDKGDEGVKGETGSTGAGMAVGGIVAWSGSASSLPDGYFLCDGSAKSRTTYDALYAVIGTTHGAGDGSTTFNLPDLSGRFVVGYDSNNNIFDVADKGGSADATLVAHGHTINDPGHFHTTVDYVARSGYAEPRNFGVGTDGNANNTGNTNSKTTGITINSNGSSATNANLPPYYALAYIIQYAQGGDVAKGQKGEAGSDGTNGTDGDKGQKGEAGADNSTKGQKGEAGSGGGDSVWETTSAGINTSSNVGIGTDLSGSNTHLLHLFNGTGCGTIGAGVGELVVESNNAATIQLLSPSNNINPQTIFFGDESSGQSGRIQYSHSSDAMLFKTNGNNERLRITSTGQLNIAGDMQFTAANPELEFNNGGPRFRVPGDNTLAIHKGGGLGTTDDEVVRITQEGNVGIGTTNPDDPVLSTNTNKLAVGIVTCHQLYVNGNEITGSGGSGSGGSSFVLLAEQSASGTEVEFTGIPADAQEITVMFRGVSLNANNNMLVQLGYSNSWIASGYVSNSENTNGSDEAHSTNGFAIFGSSGSAEFHGSMIINKSSSSSYTEIGEFRKANSGGCHARGSLSSVSGAVERLKVTIMNQNNQDAFDAGTISVSYKTSGSGGGGGVSSDPVGTIVAWAGSVASIPNEYQLCDGSVAQTTTLQSITGTNVPDLRDRFVIGANDVAAESAYPEVGIGSTGGSANAVLLSHTHGYKSANHPTSTGPEQNQGGGVEDRTTFNVDKTTTSTGIDASGTTKDDGSVSATNANLPPYYALCYIIKHTATSVSGTSKVALLKDEKNNQVNGGTFTASGWRDRDLTVKEDPSNFVTFTATPNGQSTIGSGNTPGYWSLPAGTYKIDWSAPAHEVARHKTRLVYSTTQSHISTAGLDASASFVEGSASHTATTSSQITTQSTGSKVITLTETTWFKVMHYSSATNSGEGFGRRQSSNSSTETGTNIYTQVRIEDLATAVKDVGTTKIAIIQDEKPESTNGGTVSNVDTWLVRDLNTITDPNSVGITSATDGKFSLPAGSYAINFSAPAFHVDEFQARLAYNSNENFSGTTNYVYGSSQFSGFTASSLGDITSHSTDRSRGDAIVNLTSETWFRIEQSFETSPADGAGNKFDYALGVDAHRGTGAKEVYTQVIVQDLATALKSGVTIGDKIEEGNTKAEVVDTGTDGKFVVTTEGVERIIVDPSGYLNARADIRLRRTSTNDGGLYFGDSNNNYIFGSDADDVLTFATNGTERLRIGQTGVTTSYLGTGNSDSFNIQGNASQGRTTFNVIAGNADSNGSTSMRLTRSNGNQPLNLFIEHDSDDGNIMNPIQGGNLKFHTNASGSSLEKMRITSSGLVLIKSTGQLLNESALGVYSSGNTCVLKADGATTHNPLICWNAHGYTGMRNLIQFGVTHSNGSYLARGSITTNGTATYYNASSDYRMKQDEVLITDGIEKVKSLKPRRFKWKDNLDLGMCDGFFAHEIEDATPTSQATLGTKDAVATESDVNVGLATSIGDPIYQQVDQSKLIPVLTAALKEAIAKIETLEAKVAALEG
jgi:microcystin-dependent protein